MRTPPVGGVTEPPAVASGTQPRAVLVASLAAGVAAAFESGDLEAAGVAHEAIGRLLALAGRTVGAVVDLAAERVRRGGGS